MRTFVFNNKLITDIVNANTEDYKNKTKIEKYNIFLFFAFIAN